MAEQKKEVSFKGYEIKYIDERGGWWLIYRGGQYVGRKRGLNGVKHAILLALNSKRRVEGRAERIFDSKVSAGMYASGKNTKARKHFYVVRKLIGSGYGVFKVRIRR